MPRPIHRNRRYSQVYTDIWQFFVWHHSSMLGLVQVVDLMSHEDAKSGLDVSLKPPALFLIVALSLGRRP